MRTVTIHAARVAIVAALVAAGPAVARVKLGKPVQYAGEATVAQAPTLVQPATRGDFSGVKRVVIPYFQLEVQSKGGKSESSKAFMSSMRNNVSINYKIVGLAPAGLQALTDRLYAATIAAFRTRGIEVLDRADARARSPGYAKLEAALEAGPKDFKPEGGGKSVIYGPTGLGVYMAGIENADTSGGGFPMFAGLSALTKSISSMGSVVAESAAPNELDAALVGIRLKVVFVETSSWKLNGFVQVEGRTGVSVMPLDTQLWIMAPKSQAKATGRTQFQLAAAIVPPANPIVSTVDTTSTGKKIDTMLGNLIGGASGTSSSEVQDFTVTIDPARFDAVMGETLAGTQRMLIDRLAVPGK